MNPSLHAAAPDLLAACEALVEELYFENDEGKYVECKVCGADDTEPCGEDCPIRRARHAIAKARDRVVIPIPDGAEESAVVAAHPDFQRVMADADAAFARGEGVPLGDVELGKPEAKPRQGAKGRTP